MVMLFDSVRGVLKPILKSAPSLIAIIILDWKKIVGHSFFSLCEVETIKWSPGKKNAAYGKGILILRATPAARLTLQYHHSLLISKINGYMGSEIVSSVQFSRVSPLVASSSIGSAYGLKDHCVQPDEKHKNKLEDILKRIKIIVDQQNF